MYAVSTSPTSLYAYQSYFNQLKSKSPKGFSPEVSPFVYRVTTTSPTANGTTLFQKIKKALFYGTVAGAGYFLLRKISPNQANKLKTAFQNIPTQLKALFQKLNPPTFASLKQKAAAVFKHKPATATETASTASGVKAATRKKASKTN